jgi:5-methyltetrahydropteroyltriglutamate--homocysteine methyltransferase
MRMIGRADRLTGPVVDRSHLVDQQEGIEVGEAGNRERAVDDEAATLDKTLSRDDTHVSSGIHDTSHNPAAVAPGFEHLRVDLVGSFLRPGSLRAAFSAYGAGMLAPEDLRGAQDAAIRGLIATQERHGLPIVTDGEFRRRQFMESFAEVAGTEPWRKALVASAAARIEANPAPEPLQQEHGNEVRRPVTQRLRLTRNAPLDEYAFAAKVAKKPVKVSIIGPDRLSQRYAYEESRDVYPGELDEFVDDVVRIEQEMIAGLHAAGCRYVHIDAPGYTAYVDEGTLGAMRARGEDPAKNLERSIRADNAIVAAFPELTFGIHLCRGNSRSQWHRKGSYDAIAEQLFGSLAHQRFLLEYDDERSGGFEPLRFVPKGKIVVLGLITSKRPQLESVDELRRRIDEAAKYLPLEQLALSPQCGFASGIAGNQLGEDDQWKKIDLMMQTAAAVWT